MSVTLTEAPAHHTLIGSPRHLTVRGGSLNRPTRPTRATGVRTRRLATRVQIAAAVSDAARRINELVNSKPEDLQAGELPTSRLLAELALDIIQEVPALRRPGRPAGVFPTLDGGISIVLETPAQIRTLDIEHSGISLLLIDRTTHGSMEYAIPNARTAAALLSAYVS